MPMEGKLKRDRELGPSTYALVHPNKEGRVGYQSSGGFEVKNVIPLQSTTIPPIGLGMSLELSASKLKSKGKGPYYELWCVPPQTGSGHYPYVIFRSESGADSTDVTWATVPLWYGYLTGGVNGHIEVRVYDWIQQSTGIFDHIGTASLAVPELLIGDWEGPLSLGKTFTGALTIKMKGHINNPPTLRPASAYRVQAHVDKFPLKGGYVKSPPQASLSIYGHPLDKGGESCLVAASSASQNVQFDLVVPFESAGQDGVFTPLKWNYFDGEFSASLFELCFPHAQFTFKRKFPPKNKVFKRVTSGVLVIDKVDPILDVTTGGYTLTLQASDLDITEDRFVDHQDPFIVISRGDTAIYTTEVHTATLAPHYNPFYLGVDMVGGLDTLLSLEVFVAMSTGTRGFIGKTSFSLRELIFNRRSFTLVNAAKASRFQSYTHSGKIDIVGFNVGAVQGMKQLDKPYVFVQPQPF